uniref:Uncharacterized protein n=1 Tax=Tolypiocladia glomerulata TaxID=860646 RepID=A0A1Z1MUG2_9FLOR|nr:hypothetical protein [Tolypiocladia glomerulata]ARW69723.1 hypothetical protein [Tolypiocladia glomerulata]
MYFLYWFNPTAHNHGYSKLVNYIIFKPKIKYNKADHLRD